VEKSNEIKRNDFVTYAKFKILEQYHFPSMCNEK